MNQKNDLVGTAFTLADIRSAKTSQLIALMNGDVLARALDAAGVGPLPEETLAEVVATIADEIDRRIPASVQTHTQVVTDLLSGRPVPRDEVERANTLARGLRARGIEPDAVWLIERTARCCERDTDGDGNCHVHPPHRKRP